MEFVAEELKDNTFMGKGGAVNSYGHKAHLDLIVTKGKGFRKEKDKVTHFALIVHRKRGEVIEAVPLTLYLIHLNIQQTLIRSKERFY